MQITFDQYMLLSTKETNGESIALFFGKLKELSENCELVNQADTQIRGIFIANMQDFETHQEQLQETIDPVRALRLAINVELDHINKSTPNQF